MAKQHPDAEETKPGETKVSRIRSGKKFTNAGLCLDEITTPPIFLATWAVHGANDIKTLHLKSQVNSLSTCGPLVDTLKFTTEGWNAQPS